MKVKFKRPAFIGGVLYDADIVHDIPESVFQDTVAEVEKVEAPVEKSPRPGMPKGAVILDEDVPVTDHSTTPKTAPGTKDYKGTLIGRANYETTGLEPQHNEEVEPSPNPNVQKGEPIKADLGKPGKVVEGEIQPIPDEFLDDDKPKSTRKPIKL